MKITDKFTKSEDRKNKRRRKLFIHTLGIIFFIKDYKIASWDNLSSSWSAKQNRAASYLPLPLNKIHQTNSYLESTMMK